jgi:hypothetical protein
MTITARGDGVSALEGKRSSGIGALVDSCRSCARELGVAEASPPISELFDARGERYRVALLGEQPAKARILNDFLGTDAIEPFHGLGRKRLICFSDVDHLQVADTDRRLPVTRDGWDQVDAHPGSNAVLVCVGSHVLRELSLEILDLRRAKASLASREDWMDIQSCHAVIMVVDAPSMITRTELDLLHEIAARAGPAILGVLITGIDDVDEDERPDVVRAVQRGVTRHMPGVPTLTVPQGTDGGGLLKSAVAQHLAEMRRHTGRDWIILIDLVRWVEELIVTVRHRRRVCRLSEAERERELTAFEESKRARAELWSVTRLQLRAQAAQFGESLKKDIALQARTLTVSLVDRLRKAPAEAAWLIDEMPHDLHWGMTGVARHCEERLATHIAEQVTSLTDPGIDAGSLERSAMPVPDVGALSPAAVLPMRRLDRVRLLSRLGSGVVKTMTPVLGNLLGGVQIPSLGAIVDPLSARLVDNASRDIRSRGGQLIRQCVHLTSNEFADSAAAAVSEITSQLIAEGEKSRMRLLDIQGHALSDSHPTGGERSLADLEAKLEANLKAIRRLM